MALATAGVAYSIRANTAGHASAAAAVAHSSLSGMFMIAFAGNIYRALVGSIWLRDRTCYGKGGFKPTKIQLFWINSGCIIPIDST
jgi:hypothetical protein